MSKFIGKCLALLSTIVLLGSVGTTTHAATNYNINRTNSQFKAYMPYQKITSKASKQYQLQQSATTDENGLRKYNGRYMVAVGSYFNAPVGTYLDVTLSTGTVLKCVVGDRKQDAHTDNLNLQTPNGNIVEFIIDENTLNEEVKHRGDVSKLEGFDGYVKSVLVYDEGELESDMISVPVTNVTEVDVLGKTVKALKYESETDMDTIYLNEETFSTVTPDSETFVTYNDEEVFIG